MRDISRNVNLYTYPILYEQYMIQQRDLIQLEVERQNVLGIPYPTMVKDEKKCCPLVL